jgi:Putative beta barrel porin-7 (BBP7)
MKNGALGSIAVLLAGTSLGFGQAVQMWQGSPAPYPYMAGAVYPGQGLPPTPYAPFVASQQPLQAPAPGAGDPGNGQPAWTPLDSIADGEPYHDGNHEGANGSDAVGFRVWVDPEYILWWTKTAPLSTPLVTTGPASSSGILGAPGTTVLFGSPLDYGDHSGGRLSTGFWLDEGGHVAIELAGFYLGNKTVSEFASSDVNGNPLIARPVVNALTGAPAAVAVSFPGALAGGIAISSSEELYGAETNVIGGLYRDKHFSLDALIGFRYLGLEEKLSIANATTVLPGGIAAFGGAPVAAPNGITITDRFDTRSDFYGGQIGARAEFRFNRLFLDIAGKLAVGNSHEVLNVSGTSTLFGPGGTVSSLPGGLLAVSSNTGLHDHDEFTFVPAAEVKAGVCVTRWLTAYVGYDFLYWYDAARAASQIDGTVNPTLVPTNLAFGTTGGPARPVGSVRTGDFWAQGIDFGIELRY